MKIKLRECKYSFGILDIILKITISEGGNFDIKHSYFSFFFINTCIRVSQHKDFTSLNMKIVNKNVIDIHINKEYNYNP